MLIVPLTNKKSTWEKKLKELLPQFEYFTDLQEFIDARKAGRRRLILLVHFEQMVSIIKKLKKQPWSFICIDESHRLKDRTSKQSKAAARLWQCDYKLILTGTPIEARPQDCWAEFRFLRPDLLGTNWAEFEEEYIEPPPINLKERRADGRLKYPPGSMLWKKALFTNALSRKKRKFRKDRIKQFISIIKPYSWYEKIDGPEPRFHLEWVEMFGEQRRVYDALKKNSVVRLRDGTRIMTEFEAVKQVKLHQICGGWVIDDDGDAHEVGRAKLRKTKEIVKRMGRPWVIFCHYRAEIQSILDELPGRVGVLWGREKNRDVRAQVQDDFQSGKLDGIVCQVRTGGVGIDLFRAKYLIVHSTTHSFIDFDQLISRIRLPEQTEPVDIFLVLASRTVDADKRKMLVGKGHEVGDFLRQLSRRKT